MLKGGGGEGGGYGGRIKPPGSGGGEAIGIGGEKNIHHSGEGGDGGMAGGMGGGLGALGGGAGGWLNTVQFVSVALVVISRGGGGDDSCALPGTAFQLQAMKNTSTTWMVEVCA
eukprot:3562759-Pyramimonas_sp.AAC.1